MKSQKLFGYGVFGVAILTLVMLISSFAGAAAPASNTAGLAVGYIDMERIQNELPDFVKLKEQYKDKKSELELFQGYLYQQHQNNLKGLQEKATQEKKGKSPEEQAEIDKKYKEEAQKKIDDVKAQMEKKSSEIDKAFSDLKRITFDKLRAIINTVAADQKLGVVVEKNTLFFGGTDITQQVIDKGKKDAVAAGKTPTTKK